MAEARVARQYDRWLSGGSLSGRVYSLLSTVPGSILVNTPAFRLDKNLLLRPDHKLLDVGCGQASMLRLMTSRVRFWTPPVGVDTSAIMLERAVDTTKPGPRIDLARAAATTLPFIDERFDVITCAYLVKHLDDGDLLRFLKELRRLLVYGGIAVVWEFGPTSSTTLNGLHQRLLSPGVSECNLRSYTTLNAFALDAGFEWVERARLRPFLFPPIPRVSLILGKAPRDWKAQAE